MKPFSPNDLIRVVEKLIGKPEILQGADETKLSIDVKKSGKESAYNLKWDDIKDIDKNSSKNAAQEKIEEPHKIKEPSFEPAPEDKPMASDAEVESVANQSDGISDKSDYDWFTGDLEKKMADLKLTDNPPANTEEKPDFSKTESNLKAVDEKIDFGDLPASGEQTPNESVIDNSDHSATSLKIEHSIAASVGLSEDDINRIAEKVSRKLVETLASKIDKDLILDMIKSSIEE